MDSCGLDFVADIAGRRTAAVQQAHPALEVLEREVAEAVGCGAAQQVAVEQHGWRLCCQLSPPASGAYSLLPHIDLELFVPEDYPAQLPAVRVRGVVYHSQLADSGFFSPELLGYTFRKDRDLHQDDHQDDEEDTGESEEEGEGQLDCDSSGSSHGGSHGQAQPQSQSQSQSQQLSGAQDVATAVDHRDSLPRSSASGTTEPHGPTTDGNTAVASTTSTLTRLLRLIKRAFRVPLPEPPTELDLASDEQLEALWSSHEPDCQCFLNAAMPCSYTTYAADTTSAVERQQLLQRFTRRLRRRHHHLFRASASIMQQRLQTAVAWQRQTPHPELYLTSCALTDGSQSSALAEVPASWFDPQFYGWLQLRSAPSAVEADVAAKLENLLRRESQDVFSFPLFSTEFCNLLAAEVAAFEASQLPKTRPNSMNNYGLVLNDIGLEGTLDTLLTAVFQPLAQQLLAACSDGLPLDQHHSFVVEYAEQSDIKLDMHTDDSEVTFNVNLVDDFQGAGLTFCGWHGRQEHRRESLVYQHVKGRAVVHAGLHRHGADELTHGRRLNLIVWCRSTTFRQTAAFRQRFLQPYLVEEEPDLRCLSKTHDADYEQWVEELKAGSDEPTAG